ncbi:C40 family peptidase [Streptomyces sp. NPDC006638]|uniref:C40 family peptidase n=1 Tax=Streptomyces sp. NPDC006638 TaxID=3157183 RepID=UPI0033A649F2
MKRTTTTTAILATALTVALATPADAAPSVKSRALSTAKAQNGDAYQYGAEGPSRFDCSGLTFYSYGKAGRKIPRTAQQQYNATRHVSAPKVGDLVFIGYGAKSIYHVGIYAGGGKMWNANTGSYRGRRVVLAPVSEYTAGSPRAYFGQVK